MKPVSWFFQRSANSITALLAAPCLYVECLGSATNTTTEAQLGSSLGSRCPGARLGMLYTLTEIKSKPHVFAVLIGSGISLLLAFTGCEHPYNSRLAYKTKRPPAPEQEELLPWLQIFYFPGVIVFNGAGEGRGSAGTPPGRAGFQDHGDLSPSPEPPRDPPGTCCGAPGTPGHRGDTLPGSGGAGAVGRRARKEREKGRKKGDR